MKPEMPEVTWHRTSPVAVVFNLLNAARQIGVNALPAVVVVAAAFASGGPGRKSLMATGAALLAGLAVVGAVLGWLRFRFALVDEHVRVRRGVLQREELTVDFERVQNINLREPFYMRPFGLVVLGIDTAGSKQKEVLLGGIPKALAGEIRETILAAARKTQAADEPAEEAGKSAGQLLSRSTRDIVIYGLTANFILWFALAVGAVMSAGDGGEKLFVWLAERFHFIEYLVAWQESASIVERTLWALGLGAVVILLLPLFSVLGALFRHHGYRLTVDGETYRRAGGLLTRHEESLKRHKIQAVVLRQNVIARWFQRINMQLRVASAGVGVESGQLAAMMGTSFMVPALHPDEADELRAEFLPGCARGEVTFSRTDRRRLLTVILGIITLAVLPATLSLSLLVNGKFIVILLLALGVAALAANRYWKQAGYAVVGEHGFVRYGFFGTTTTVFPLFKVQRVDIVQTPGQRKRGLAHLVIHLASHTINVHFLSLRDAETFRDLALCRAESSSRAWY